MTVFLYSHTCFYSPRPRQNRALSPSGNAMWHNTKGWHCKTEQNLSFFFSECNVYQTHVPKGVFVCLGLTCVIRSVCFVRLFVCLVLTIAFVCLFLFLVRWDSLDTTWGQSYFATHNQSTPQYQRPVSKSIQVVSHTKPIDTLVGLTRTPQTNTRALKLA